MRIHVKGDSTSAAALRGLLGRAGFALVTAPPQHGYVIDITESLDVACPVVDGIDCELERQIVTCVSELVTTDIVLRRRGGHVTGEREIAITVPSNPAIQEGVEIGVLRGLLRMFPQPGQDTVTTAAVDVDPAPWWRRLFS